MRVLVIEDDAAVAQLLTDLLESEDVDVTCVSDGQVAYDLYCSRPFDFVLTGIDQPGMNGADLVKAILKRNPRQRIAFTTAHPVLQKPFSKNALFALLETKSL